MKVSYTLQKAEGSAEAVLDILWDIEAIREE
jgi:hypothetical protein